MNIAPSQVELLAKVLEAANLRHKVLAHNIANINTPNFKRLEVSFEDTLARQLGQGNPADVAAVKPEIVAGTGDAARADGNNVDIDREVGRAVKNTLLANAFTQILASKLAGMRAAITGR